MQQFVADSPWDPAIVVRAVAERVEPEIEAEAWVLDDTGFPKDGKDSPVSSASTRARWARPVTVRSVCPGHAVGALERCRWDGRCISPRNDADQAAAAEGQDPH